MLVFAFWNAFRSASVVFGGLLIVVEARFGGEGLLGVVPQEERENELELLDGVEERVELEEDFRVPQVDLEKLLERDELLRPKLLRLLLLLPQLLRLNEPLLRR